MSTDPYTVVKDEIQSTLQAAESLLSSYRRIRSTAREDSEELNYAKSEVRANVQRFLPRVSKLNPTLLKPHLVLDYNF